MSELGKNWALSDVTVAAFFDHLQGAFPRHPTTHRPPLWFRRLRRQCEDREREGRMQFGFAYLDRDNVVEADEELADGINYCLFETLRRRKAGETESGHLLQAAWHMAKAYEALENDRMGEP